MNTGASQPAGAARLLRLRLLPLLGALLVPLPRQVRAVGMVWAPLYDQFAQRSLESFQVRFFNHPDFPLGQGRNSTREKIRGSLDAAHQRGIRTLDIQFFLTRDLVQEDYGRAYADTDGSRPSAWDRSIPGFADATQDWLEAVAAFNHAHAADPFRVRLRVSAQATYLYYVYRTLKPYRTRLAKEIPGKNVRSRFRDLPLDPCFEKPLMGDSCRKTSSVPMDYYRSRNGDGALSPLVPNLANPPIRAAIAGWAKLAIDETEKLLGCDGAIQEVSLALDAGYESSLFIDDGGGVAAIGSKPYRADSDPENRMAFFRDREGYLKKTYQAFADAVHARRNLDGTPIMAGIFQQTHHLDGRSRGTFDLYGLLKGSGIDVLHHTHPPMPYDQCLMLAAFSASVAKRLGIAFDTEFSWAHFGGPGFLEWHQELLTPANAACFLQQAQAGIRYGASDLVYCNWAMHDILSPPADPAWKAIIGGKMGAPGGTARPDGFDGTQPFPPRARYAIYISDWGRMECEEAKVRKRYEQACDVHTYMDWFREFGLSGTLLSQGPLFTERIDILTDAMLLEAGMDLSGYEAVFLPKQTSGRVDGRVRRRLAGLTAGIKARFRVQTVSHQPANGTFKEWNDAVIEEPGIP